MPRLDPYLNFNGDCEAAFEHYKSVFGGEFLAMSRFSDMPPNEEFPLEDDERDNVMHVSLPIGEHSVLMGSDSPKSMGGTDFGDNVSISVATASEAETERLCNAMAEGGQVTMAPAKTFWNAYFGMCVDRFGVHWMFNHDYGEEKIP